MKSLTFYRANQDDQHDVQMIQKILSEAPTYNQNTQGEPISPQAASETFKALPPNCSFEQKYVLIFKSDDSPFAVIDFISGFPNPETGFIGLLILSEKFQGRGLGKDIYTVFEQWTLSSFQLKKLRLAVVDSNPAVPFWNKMGFTLTQEEPRVHEGAKVKSFKRVMEKQL